MSAITDDGAACESRWHLVGPTRAQPVCLDCRTEPPVSSRERVAEVLGKVEGFRAGVGHAVHGYDAGCLVCQGDPVGITSALLAAGVFREPQPECGAVDRTGQRRCVFTPGHHEAENWTSHGDRGGWTWNDQPAED